jgi:hypothetical protein
MNGIRRTWLALLVVGSCLSPLHAQSSASQTRIALFQPSGPKDDAALTAVLNTVADSVDLNLAVLQRFEVTRLPAVDPAADLEQVRAYCRKNKIDQAILGSGSATTEGGYQFRLVVYDRKTDHITTDQQGTSKGALDMFDVTDTLVGSLLDALNGAHLAFGSLSVQSDPAGATVAVNGKDVGTAPVSIRALPVGTVEIAARMEGRESSKTTVTISDGETVSASLTLPLSEGTLIVEMPRDAVATIQGAVGSPQTVNGPGSIQLATGDYKVQASSFGLPDVSGKVTISRGQNAHWLPWAKGYLQVQTDPPGATLSVDGKDVGKAPMIVELEPGAVHHLDLRLPGYQAYSADLSEDAGTKTLLARTLAKGESPPAAVGPAMVVFKNVPSNVASVFIGDHEQAAYGADQQFELAPNVTTTIAFKTTGGSRSPVSMDVTAKAGESVTVEVPAGTLTAPYLPVGTGVTIEGSDVSLAPGDDGKGHSAPLLAQKYEFLISSKYGGSYNGTVEVAAGKDVALVVPESYLVKVYTGVRDKEKASWNTRNLDRAVGWGGLAVGVMGAAGAGVSYLLGSQAYQSLISSSSASATSSAAQQVQLYADTLIAGAAVAGVGFIVGPTFWFLSSRQPVKDDKGIKALDRRISELAGTPRGQK